MRNFLIPRSAAALMIICFTLLPLIQMARAGEEFGGLGMMVAQLYDEEVENGRGDIVVLGVLAKSPAAKAGIKAGDTITHIDEEAVSGKTFEQIVTTELRGPIGTVSRLTIKRPLRDKTMSFAIKRVRIKSPQQPQ